MKFAGRVLFKIIGGTVLTALVRLLLGTAFAALLVYPETGFWTTVALVFLLVNFEIHLLTHKIKEITLALLGKK